MARKRSTTSLKFTEKMLQFRLFSIRDTIMKRYGLIGYLFLSKRNDCSCTVSV